MESKKILITGGTGTVGLMITELLLAEGHKVVWLSRKKQSGKSNLEIYDWNIEKSYINPLALENVDAIVHLAGAGVADEAWSEERKKEIADSRILAAKLLFDAVSKSEKKPECFISASAVGYYGFDTGDVLLTETSNRGEGFLADICDDWEKAAFRFESIGVRTAALRIGIVLSKKGGAYEKMIMPVKFGLGAALGSGKQFISWIHVRDLARMFYFAVSNTKISGVFNAVADAPVTNEEFNKIAARVFEKPFWLPKVPSFFLEIALGERAALVLGGNRASAQKIKEAGFKFEFPTLEAAVRDLS
jgi:uncharacterized protein (TIGR01777 family)